MKFVNKSAVFIISLPIFALQGMSISVSEDSQQAIKDCVKRFESFEQQAKKIRAQERGFAYVESSPLDKDGIYAFIVAPNISKDQLMGQATDLFLDISALMQRFPEGKASLMDALREKYKASYENKCKNTFKEFDVDQKNNPEARFYTAIQNVATMRYHDFSLGDMSMEKLLALRKRMTDDTELANEHKMCLREIMSNFESPYSQQLYDAFIVGDVEPLKISEKDNNLLLGMVTQIQEIKVDLSEI